LRSARRRESSSALDGGKPLGPRACTTLDTARIWRGRGRLGDGLLDALLEERLDDDTWLNDSLLNDALLEAVAEDVFRAISLTAQEIND
jgi:hypothetical protein